MVRLGQGVIIPTIADRDEFGFNGPNYDEGTPEFNKAHGRTIASFDIDDNELTILFADGTSLNIEDVPSCCANHYMHTDDDLTALVGGKLCDLDLVRGPDEKDDDGYGEHETAFLKIRTTQGDATIVTHNEHSGYYGGFSLKLTFWA